MFVSIPIGPPLAHCSLSYVQELQSLGYSFLRTIARFLLVHFYTFHRSCLFFSHHVTRPFNLNFVSRLVFLSQSTRRREIVAALYCPDKCATTLSCLDIPNKVLHMFLKHKRWPGLPASICFSRKRLIICASHYCPN